MLHVVSERTVGCVTAVFKTAHVRQFAVPVSGAVQWQCQSLGPQLRDRGPLLSFPFLSVIVHPSWVSQAPRVLSYSSTCHRRPPLVRSKGGRPWQVAPRDREWTYDMSNQANTSDSIHCVAHARHYKAQRSITMLYTVRDETNNAENVWGKKQHHLFTVT